MFHILASQAWEREQLMRSLILFMCFSPASLNREKRKQEQRRVAQENRAILGRVTKSEPRYRVRRWHEDWQRAEKYMANVARHPCGQCKSQSRKVAPSSSSFLPGYFWMGSVRRAHLAVLLRESYCCTISSLSFTRPLLSGESQSGFQTLLGDLKCCSFYSQTLHRRKTALRNRNQ